VIAVRVGEDHALDRRARGKQGREVVAGRRVTIDAAESAVVAAVDDDVQAIQATVTGDPVVAGVNPDTVARADIDEVDLELVSCGLTGGKRGRGPRDAKVAVRARLPGRVVSRTDAAEGRCRKQRACKRPQPQVRTRCGGGSPFGVERVRVHAGFGGNGPATVSHFEAGDERTGSRTKGRRTTP